MLSEEDPIEVLISAIEHFSYCPRQCTLIHVEQSYSENIHTVRGTLAHERVDSGERTARAGVVVRRDVPLWSERLWIRGKADTVEFHGMVPYPVEYKVGAPKGTHANLQLCAQALCLEEMLGVAVPEGAIFYHKLRRRVEVPFSPRLREETESVIAAIRETLVRQILPEAPNDARCPKCSLLQVCLPHVVSETHRIGGLQAALFHPYGDVEL